MTSGDFVHQIVAGDDHTCALVGSSAGEQYAYCWGRNDVRQVTNGDGTAEPDVLPLPVKVTTPLDVAQLAAGRSHSCAIESSNAIYCWGGNDVGQLGRTGTSMNGDNTIPSPASGLWSAIAAGAGATCAVNSNGELTCWGAVYGESTPLLPKNYGLTGTWKWEQIAIGSHAIIGVATDPANNMKHITGWGQRCQMDLSGTGTDPTPLAQSQILDGADYSNIRLAVAQADGGHACAALQRVSQTSGTIECWGDNGSNQVDPNTTACRGDSTIQDPQTVPSVVHWHLPSPTQAMVVVANEHTCALDQNNQAYCWGSAKTHALGGLTGTGTPTLFSSQRWFALATGTSHTCGIDDMNKHVLCWGQGKFGQLGDGSRYWPVPTPGGLIH